MSFQNKLKQKQKQKKKKQTSFSETEESTTDTTEKKRDSRKRHDGGGCKTEVPSEGKEGSKSFQCSFRKGMGLDCFHSEVTSTTYGTPSTHQYVHLQCLPNRLLCKACKFTDWLLSIHTPVQEG